MVHLPFQSICRYVVSTSGERYGYVAGRSLNAHQSAAIMITDNITMNLQ